MTLSRVVVILACAAYAAAYRCALCVGQLDNYYHINPYATCYKEDTNTHAFITHCEYDAAHSPIVEHCDYTATGELNLGSGSAPLCPAKVAINDMDNCSPCKGH